MEIPNSLTKRRCRAILRAGYTHTRPAYCCNEFARVAKFRADGGETVGSFMYAANQIDISSVVRHSGRSAISYWSIDLRQHAQHQK